MPKNSHTLLSDIGGVKSCTAVAIARIGAGEMTEVELFPCGQITIEIIALHCM
jgi:hypothetical protein